MCPVSHGLMALYSRRNSGSSIFPRHRHLRSITYRSHDENVARRLAGRRRGTASGRDHLGNWIQNLDFQPQVADSAIELIKTVAALTRKSLREIASIDPQIRMKTELID